MIPDEKQYPTIVPAQTASRFSGGERVFRRLLEHLPAGAYTCDVSGLITYYNERAVELWGRAPRLDHEEDRFCGSFRLFSSDGNAIRHDQCWMALALQNDEEYNGREILIERPDGTRLAALAHANPIHDESGHLLGAVNVLVDISDRKHAEDALRAADRSKDEFLATLAHELRNPLAPLRNATYLLRRHAPANPETRSAVDVIERQLSHMTRLIDDLLDVSRITRNKLDLKIERVTVADVMRLAIETSRPVLESSRTELTVTTPPGTIELDADPTRLAQALANLLNNAAKFTEPGGKITMVAERQGSDAVIAVRDTGIGIPADMLSRIFDMFTQVDRSLERTQGGLGIGLTLVKRLVELHGGSVEARSAGTARGSEFTVRLPIALDSRPRRAPPSATHPAIVSSRRILVVDDSRDAAVTLGLLLEAAGHDVRTAHDGAVATQAAGEMRPDVMVLDIGLPHMNGYEVARWIREQPWGADVVLIAMTGWGQEGDRQRSRAAGFDHHLVKPVDPGDLFELLARVERPVTRTAHDEPDAP
jgi:PAS domain S-box-containing protein